MKGAHEVVVTVEEVILVVTKSHLVATVFREEHSVALFHGDGADLTIVQSFPRANSDDNTKVELFLLVLREEDATLGLGQGLGLLDENAVHQGTQLLECDHI